MPSQNRIAIIGHRGWVSSAIVDAFAASGGDVKVLYGPGSDVSGLAPHMTKVEVDLEDQESLVSALKDIDIVISLAGHEQVERQKYIIQAIPHTNVKLFSPSDLASRYDEQGLQIPVNKSKHEIEEAAHEMGIPTTVILPGNFAEFALSTRAMGVDIEENKLIFTANSDKEELNICTRSYVAAAYVSIFLETPISQLKNRNIGLSEMKITGSNLAKYLQKKHGKEPEIYRHSLAKADSEIKAALESGSRFSLARYCRKIWGTGQQINMIGEDIWDLAGFPKASLEKLILNGDLQPYREMPGFIDEYFRSTFVSFEE